jgi:hypothetical protein
VDRVELQNLDHAKYGRQNKLDGLKKQSPINLPAPASLLSSDLAHKLELKETQRVVKFIRPMILAYE